MSRKNKYRIIIINKFGLIIFKNKKQLYIL